MTWKSSPLSSFYLNDLEQVLLLTEHRGANGAVSYRAMDLGRARLEVEIALSTASNSQDSV